MAKTKQQKKEIIEKLEAAFKSAAAAVFVGFSGVTALSETAMRRELRAEGVHYTVAKKTLIRRALEAAGFTSDMPLEGEVAVAYTTSDDVTAPARLMHGFGKKGAGKIALLGGIFEGKIVGGVAINEIAMIPTMEVLRGMFANIINSPRQRFAVALGQVVGKKN